MIDAPGALPPHWLPWVAGLCFGGGQVQSRDWNASWSVLQMTAIFVRRVWGRASCRHPVLMICFWLCSCLS